MKLRWNTATLLHLGIMYGGSNTAATVLRNCTKGAIKGSRNSTLLLGTLQTDVSIHLYDVMPVQNVNIRVLSSYVEFLKLHNSKFIALTCIYVSFLTEQ